MDLFPKEIMDKLPAMNEVDGQGDDMKVPLHLFSPVGRGDWYIVAKDEDRKDVLWGYAAISYFEFGTVPMSELKDIKLPFGMGIERDLGWRDKTVADAIEDARIKGYEGAC